MVKSVMESENKKKNIQLNLFKGFSIIAIVFLHGEIIPLWFSIWAIPVFVFTTSALYYQSLNRIKFKKIVFRVLWVFSLIFLFTSLFYIFGISQISSWENISISPNFWVIRNPYLGNLWYFILYFQILLFLFFVRWFKFNNNFKKLRFGFLCFLISEAISYLLLLFFAKGISINFVSWLFLIWLGVFYYKEISDYIRIIYFKKPIKFYFLNLAAIIIIFIILLIGGENYQRFLSLRSHDFIFPTFILQLSYLLILFSLTTLIIEKIPFLSNVLASVGKYSLYIYLFHIMIARIIFGHFGVFGFLISIPVSMLIGCFLENFRIKIFKNEKNLSFKL